MDIKQQRLDILYQITRLDEQRCRYCSGTNTNVHRDCCKANREIRKLGKRLDKLLPPRRKLNGEISKGQYAYWLQIAEENGIAKKTYENRIYQSGMDYEKAATYNVRKKKHRITDEQLQIAAQNGLTKRDVQLCVSTQVNR